MQSRLERRNAAANDAAIRFQHFFQVLPGKGKMSGMKKEGLAADLRMLVENHSDDDISLRAVLDILGNRSFGLVLALLSLPSAMPVPAPGYSTPFGIVIVLLGLQMLVGKSTPVLPSWALDRKMKSKTTNKVFRAGISFFDKTVHLIKPRFSSMGSRAARSLISVLVILMACLMILPIPLTNTLPAMVIFLVGVGLSERDGVMIAIAVLAGLFATAVYAGVVWMFYSLGLHSSGAILEYFKSLF